MQTLAAPQRHAQLQNFRANQHTQMCADYALMIGIPLSDNFQNLIERGIWLVYFLALRRFFLIEGNFQILVGQAVNKTQKFRGAPNHPYHLQAFALN
jgi:hypothetical protein